MHAEHSAARPAPPVPVAEAELEETVELARAVFLLLDRLRLGVEIVLERCGAGVVRRVVALVISLDGEYPEIFPPDVETRNRPRLEALVGVASVEGQNNVSPSFVDLGPRCLDAPLERGLGKTNMKQYRATPRENGGWDPPPIPAVCLPFLSHCRPPRQAALPAPSSRHNTPRSSRQLVAGHARSWRVILDLPSNDRLGVVEVGAGPDALQSVWVASRRLRRQRCSQSGASAGGLSVAKVLEQGIHGVWRRRSAVQSQLLCTVKQILDCRCQSSTGCPAWPGTEFTVSRWDMLGIPSLSLWDCWASTSEKPGRSS